MNRTRVLLYMVLSCVFTAFSFVITALATKEWIHLQIFNTKIFSAGLWEYCFADKCFLDVAIIPAVLTIITAVLIVISLTLTPLMNYSQRLSSKISFIPMAFLFMAIIILLSTIVVAWPELPYRNYEKVLNSVTDMTPMIKQKLDTIKNMDFNVNSNILTTFESLFENQNLDMFNNLNLRRTLSIKYGFSAILFISALPLLIISLVLSAFIAAFHIAEYNVSNNHRITVHQNYH
ncbi:hypothetical protein I4U23_012311 [Adineta vaga]|nr:hypothetical protein I4U23_012311 [Adineta vaga]